MTTTQVGKQLGIKVGQLVSRVGALPQPSFTDSNGSGTLTKSG